MSKEHSSVLAAGIVTSLATAFAITLVHSATGFNFFTFSLWFVIPAGAGLAGFAAASGYYFAAKYLHVMPSKRLLLEMAAVAALTQVLIYWLEYKTAVVDGQNVSALIPLSVYMDVILTKTHYQVGRAGQIDAGEVGSFGYFLALLQFLGFMIGGAFVYIWLRGEAACTSCKRYLQTLAKKEDSFDDYDQYIAYRQGEFDHPLDSVEFADYVGKDYTASDVTEGSVRLETRVLGCPTCGEQFVRHKTWLLQAKAWKEVEALNDVIAMPAGVNVAWAYAAAR